MQATSKRTTGQVRLALMLIIGVAAAAACVLTLMWWKAPASSAQEVIEDPTGANFVVSCEFSHRAQIDPIVGEGHHMHDFFGNTSTAADSTLDTLRAATSRPDGGTTCPKLGEAPPEDPAPLGDTAAYWIPTVSWTDSNGTKTELEANQTFFYYKLGGKSPNFDVEPRPNGPIKVDGLKVITVQGKNVEWRCQNGKWDTSPPEQCSNRTLVVRIKFPDCLAKDANGPLLDSADHRSHMVDSVRQENSAYKKCPSTHPIPLPMLQTNFQFPLPTTTGTVTLSSGAYSTMHADFFNAWQVGALEDLVARCINKAPFTSSNPKPTDCA
jgi:hypothetical protein